MRKKIPPVAKPQVEPTTQPALDIDETRIVQRPDGYYWLADEGRREVGPFNSFEDAMADMRSAEDTGLEPAETLQEAEDEIGIADWIDPDTHEPAEEQRPHIDDN